jgi:hypothetical protein
LRLGDRPVAPLAPLVPGGLFLPALAFTAPLFAFELKSGFARRLIVDRAPPSFFGRVRRLVGSLQNKTRRNCSNVRQFEILPDI